MKDRRTPRGMARPVRAVMAITAGLVGCTAALVATAPAAGVALEPTGPLVLALLVGGFLLAELVVFHLEYRRETLTFSLSEVPLAFALVFLAPHAAVAARCVGALLAMALVRPHPRPFKVAFNVALFGCEAALASTLVRHLAGAGAGPSPGRLMVATVVALVATTVAGLLLVSLVVSFFEGGLLRRLAGELRTGVAVYVWGPVLGAVAVSVALLDPWLTPLPLLLIAALWALLRSLGQLAQSHRDLVAVHGFTGAVGRTLELGRIADAAVSEVRRLLRAEHCALVVTDPATDRRLVSTGSDELLPAAPAVVGELRRRRHGHAPLVLDQHDLHRLVPGLGAAGIAEVVAATVGDGGDPFALLLVANREGAQAHFSGDDLGRLQALTGQLAAALRNGLLHDQIEHQVTHDRLTGLANRTLFERELAGALERGGDGVLGVLMLDLDRFKEVNDTLGHHVGDRLLEGFSLRVLSIVEPGDVLARFAGDEFALLAHRRSTAELERLASAIVTALRKPFDLGELSVVVSGSIGVAVAPDHGHDTSTLLRRADIAMYEAKSHHSGWEAYRSQIDRSSEGRLALHGDLRAALEHGRIVAHYQPKVHLATGTVVGVEALARWDHPSRGPVPPDVFISLAEQTGLIHQLTDQVLCAALAAAHAWQAAGIDLSVAVNLSTHNLLDELLPDRVARLLARHGVDPERLTLEITETSVLSDAARTSITLDRLHRLGVRLSVDDFGTGYSSLSYLRRLPLDEVKVDRSFVTDLLLAGQDEVIVRSTIDLGHNLGLQVVAEGAEGPAVLERLRSLGCDVAQGFGISRPLPREAFDTWLTTAPYRVRRSGDRVGEASRA